MLFQKRNRDLASLLQQHSQINDQLNKQLVELVRNSVRKTISVCFVCDHPLTAVVVALLATQSVCFSSVLHQVAYCRFAALTLDLSENCLCHSRRL